MLRIFPSFAAAVATMWLSVVPHAAGSPPFGAKPPLTLSGPANLIGNVLVSVGKADGSLTPLGHTDASGAMAYDVSILMGKPKVDVVIIQCQSQTPQLSVQLWSAGAGQNVAAPNGCSKNRKNGYADWGGAIRIEVLIILGAAPGSSPSASGDQSSFLHSPWPYVIVGGVAGGIIAAEAGGSSSSTGGSTTPGSTAPSESTVVNRTVSLSGTIGSGSTTCGPATESGSITFSGTATNTIGLIAQLLPGVSAATVPGSVSSPSSSSFHFTGSSGTIALDLTFQVSSDNTTVTVTGTITATGSCPVTYNVTGTFHL